jgi:hypothetical protein
MQRRTISLPDRVAAALDREARRRRVPVSQVAREAIEERLGLQEEKGERPKRHIPFAGIVSGDNPNVSRDWDEILAATWADDIAADRDR